MLSYLASKVNGSSSIKEQLNEFAVKQYKALRDKSPNDVYIRQNKDIIVQDMIHFWARLIVRLVTLENLEGQRDMEEDFWLSGFLSTGEGDEKSLLEVKYDESQCLFTCDQMSPKALYDLITDKLKFVALWYDRMTYHLYNKIMDLFREYDKKYPGEGVMQESDGVHALNYAYRGDWDSVDNDVEKTYQDRLPKYMGTDEFPWFFEYCLQRDEKTRRFWAVHYSVFTRARDENGVYQVEQDLDKLLDLNIVIDEQVHCIRHVDYVWIPKLERFVHKNDLHLYQ